jgi:tetratricopeptide (TPR) repeat protein
VLAGLDRYAARWAAGHRDACLDHRRGELSATIFDARVRCLERRRLALGSAVAALTAAEPAAEPAQVVARLPALDACDDPDSALSETTSPEDLALAATARELDARLIDARTRYNAGDVRGTRAAADAVVAEARRLGFRPLLAEALLLRGRLDETEREFRRGREAVDEAAVHALATRRDDLAAEALARRIFFDGQLDAVDDALADAPIARAVAERLPAPAAALARLENNLGHLFFMRRDIDGARPHFERATEALERTADGDPIERAFYWENLALVTRDPAAREQAFVRATSSLTQHLGDRHLLALDRRRLHAQHAADARTAAAMLGELCPRYPESYPDAYPSCVECFQSLGHLRAALGQREAAADAFAGVDVCLARSPDERAQAVRFADFHDRAAAFAALLRDRPEAALAHADAALARLEPYQSLWWIAAEIAELELARGRALLATGHPDEARAALTNALPVFEDMTKTTVLLLPQLWRDEARALLDRSPATP